MKKLSWVPIIIAILPLLIGLANGCSGYGAAMNTAEQPSLNVNDPLVASAVKAEDRLRAYRRASLIFLKEIPTQEKLAAVGFKDAYDQAIDELINSETFVTTMRGYHQDFFKMKGRDGKINLNEPANLAARLIKENEDFREILRATYCVDDNLDKTSCSSFSGSEELAEEQGAGVVTTQAFLKKWESAFNFTRTSEMLQAFGCKDYPDEDDSGMTLTEISESVHTFACTNCIPACYSCHRTMNPRAALFYDFDTSGVFNLSQKGDLAIKRDDGSVSKISDLLTGDSVPRFQQKPVHSLKQYALELSRAPKFRRCLAKRLTLLSLGATSHAGLLPTLLEDADELMIRHEFRIKDFYQDLLRSEAYVLQ